MLEEKDGENGGERLNDAEGDELLEEENELSAATPIGVGVSGLYEWTLSLPRPGLPTPPIARSVGKGQVSEESETSQAIADLDAIDATSVAFVFKREELRLDVDGRYPQMVASGTLYNGLAVRIDWVAKLSKVSANKWTGAIFYKNGDAAALPHTQVSVKASPSPWAESKQARVIFTGGGGPARSVTYKFKSRYYHPVQFEFDSVVGTTAVTSVRTHDHPNRPASLASESLKLETVYSRAGFAVAPSTSGPVPLPAAGADVRWSDAEMHDAMQVYWSKWANKPQWAMWVLSASLHESGSSLGGIMFDDLGPNHRQGTAVFNDAFIANAPAGDANPTAWVRRMRFWTICHEMGHAFNLAHSWQKSLGSPWIPLVNEPEARSFMNYPYSVAGGQAAFFASFAYRFSDAELLFMRHAPAKFVQMGNADWFDHHGFEQADEGDAGLQLTTRVNRPRAAFEFLEPVVIELKLKNTSDRTVLVDENALSGDHATTVIIKKEGKPARQWYPYARRCLKPNPVALKPGEALYGSLFVSAGLNGWDLAEPGRYAIQVAIQHDELEVLSPALALKVQPPQAWEEQRLAQDLFSTDVGRVMAFDGSKHLQQANDTLREVAARLPGYKVAPHALVALDAPDLRRFRLLGLSGAQPGFTSVDASEQAVSEMEGALLREPTAVAETLGHIDYKYYVDRLTDALAERGDRERAANGQAVMCKALAERKVLPEILAESERRRNAYQRGHKLGGGVASASV